MIRESARPGTAGGVSLREKLRKPVALAGIIGSLALAGSAGSSNKTAGLEGVGFNTNQVWVADATEAQAEADRIVQIGGNTISISDPYTQGGPNNDNDAERICTAAETAVDNHFDLIIRREGRYRNGHLGYIPLRASEKRRYLTSQVNLLNILVGPDGCAKDLKRLYLSPFNEPNNKVFDNHQYFRGRWVSPEHIIGLYSYIYEPLHTEADKLGLDLEIIGGENAQRDFTPFMLSMEKVIKDRHIKGKLMDVFAKHYYLQGPDSESQRIALADIPRTQRLVSKVFGPAIPTWYTELGAATYETGDSLPIAVSAEQQGQFYRDFIDEAACRGIGRVLIFHVVDDGSRLTTGVYKPPDASIDERSPIPKLSVPVVTQSMHEATDDSIVCSQ